ncbi:MAG: FkbM family methyltransferase [Acidimicrobiales bacterium]
MIARTTARRLLRHEGLSLATAADLRACYRLLLGRRPDRRGELDFLSLIERGMTTDELVAHFMSSPEFRSRQLAQDKTTGAPVSIAVDDLVLYLDPADFAIGPHLSRPGGYEPEVLAALQRTLRPGDTFVDVGASFGYFSTRIGRHVGPEGKVISFEPGPQNQSLLLLNLTANAVTGAEVHQVALSDRPGLFTYSRSGANGVISVFGGDPRELSNHDLVRASTLDHEIARRPVHAIKVDAEGAEGLVLHGGRTILRDARPTVVFEFSPPALEAVSKMRAKDLLEFLVELGYSIDVIDRSNRDRAARLPSELMDRYERAPEGHLNLMAWSRG